jgi:hypothetical protein
VSTALGRQDEEWPTNVEMVGNTVIPPKPDGPVQVYIFQTRPARPLPPPRHHTPGAMTIPGPVLTEPER